MNSISNCNRFCFFFSIFLFPALVIFGQKNYSVSNGHAHNDYRYNQPFVQAHRLGFGSIEVDVLLLNDTLFVGHDLTEARKGLTFEAGYIQPLASIIEKNSYVYGDSSKQLQLLIDLKTESHSTMAAVVSVLNKYQQLAGNKSVKFVITGNQPKADKFYLHPLHIYFDGNFSDSLHFNTSLPRIGVFSANFRKYSAWKGDRRFKGKEKRIIKSLIRQAHRVNRPVRFWGAPDTPAAWKVLMKLGVDYINTDRITEFAAFVSEEKR